jgi:hypothetical protein
MARLQLKTIVSLVPEPPTSDLVAFAKVSGITVHHVLISRSASLNDSLLQQLIQALNVK